MVQTRAAARRIGSGEAPPQDNADIPSPTKKRRRDGAEPPKKRRRGKPGELCQLNFDVLFLIAAYVHPLDLLNLARTCKSLRELLMDRSSAFIWRAARCQVKGLPDCPADLTEPEYANLVFYARCHGCGKHAKKVLWTMRRRYCPDCRAKRLLPLSSCPEFVLRSNAIAMEQLEKEHEVMMCVDKEQMDSFVEEYNRSSNKKQFLSEKQCQYSAIHSHARNCRYWERVVASERRFVLEFRRQDRDQSIFERLKQHGYEPEIKYAGHYAIKQSHKSFFRTSKPLTDKEWDRMWPEWLETMNHFRYQRIENTVYQPRRNLLTSEYASYMMSPPPNTPDFDLLPPLTDLFRFSPFRDIIQAPAGTEVGAKPFDSAFEQLPPLVDDWKREMDAEFAQLIKIPPELSSTDMSGEARPGESLQTPADRLRLACAVFETVCVVARYPDVLSPTIYRPGLICHKGDSEHAVSMRERFRVKFKVDAPYIVFACGLDPDVATVEDMDRRNARLKCLSCNTPYIKSWRTAMLHTHPNMSPNWQIVSDEYIDAIQAAELSVENQPLERWTRCSLCRPCVGDGMLRADIICHLVGRHHIKREDIEHGVHYVPVGMHEHCKVQMIEEEGEVTFKAQSVQMSVQTSVQIF